MTNHLCCDSIPDTVFQYAIDTDSVASTNTILSMSTSNRMSKSVFCRTMSKKMQTHGAVDLRPLLHCFNHDKHAKNAPPIPTPSCPACTARTRTPGRFGDKSHSQDDDVPIIAHPASQRTRIIIADSYSNKHKKSVEQEAEHDYGWHVVVDVA